MITDIRGFSLQGPQLCQARLGVDRNRSTLSNVRGRPQLGWGWTATVLRFQMLLVPDVVCTQSKNDVNAHNQFAVLSVPHPAAQPQALNFLGADEKD